MIKRYFYFFINKVSFEPSDWQDLSREVRRYRQQEETNDLLRLQILNQQRITQGLPPLTSLPKTKSEIAWDFFGRVFLKVVVLCIFAFFCWVGFIALSNYFETKQRVAELIKSADSGVADSQYELALAYEKGGTQGIEQNKDLAKKWLTKASEGGHALSTLKLADSNFSSGDFTAAYTRYELAAKQGSPSAQIKIGQAYLTGEHISQDLEKAEVWLRKALLDPIEKAKAERLLKDLEKAKDSLLAQRNLLALKATLADFSSLQKDLIIFIRSLEEQKVIDMPKKVLLRDSPFLQPALFSVTSFSIVGNEVFVRKANAVGKPSIYSKRLYCGSYSAPSADSYLLSFQVIDAQIKDIFALQRNFPDLVPQLEEDHKKWLAAAKNRVVFLSDNLNKIDQFNQSMVDALEKIIKDLPLEVKNNGAFKEKYASIKTDLFTLSQIKNRFEQERKSLNNMP